MVAMIIVVIAMIIFIPVAFVQMPAVLVVVVVRMAPVRTSIRRMIPASGNPYIPASVVAPVTVDPGIAFARHRRTTLIAHRWRRLATDNDADLRGRRSRESGSCNGGHGQRTDK